MSENYIVINGKRAELTEEQMEQLGIEVERRKRWRARGADENEGYYFVSSGGIVVSECDCNHDYDNYRYYSHNYFQTREEAETYARVLKTEMLLKKYADEHNGEFSEYKYTLCVNKNGALIIDLDCVENHYNRIVWFSSIEITRNVINEIGEDRIKEYLTYEW